MQKCHWQEIIFIAVIFCYKQKVILTAKRRGDSLPNKFHDKVGTWICSLWMLRITGQSNEISNFPFSHQSDQPGQPMYLNISGLGIRSSVFWANRLFLPKNERMSNLLKITSNSLIFGERLEWFAHGRSFLVSDLSESLIFGEQPEQIAHFWWATWAICSHHSPKKREWANHSFFK